MANSFNLNKTQKSRQTPNNIFPVKTRFKDLFFKQWCVFLRPFMKLTNKEIEVMASLLKYRDELSRTIPDQTVLDTLTMSDVVRSKVLKDCGITLQHFYVIMGNLRKNGIIKKNVIDPKVIPNIRHTSDNYFQLLILFKEDGI